MGFYCGSELDPTATEADCRSKCTSNTKCMGYVHRYRNVHNNIHTIIHHRNSSLDGPTYTDCGLIPNSQNCDDVLDCHYLETKKGEVAKSPAEIIKGSFDGNHLKGFYCYAKNIGDNKVGQWGEWSQCSESCGTGFKVRSRAKTGVKSVDGTRTGKDEEREECRIRNNHCEPI